MAIQNRRGNFVDFDPYKMLAGEFAYALDTEELYYCVSPGNVKRCATKEDIAEILETSEEAYIALQQLITELENETVLNGILADISNLLDDVAINKSKIATLESDLDMHLAETTQELESVKTSKADKTFVENSLNLKRDKSVPIGLNDVDSDLLSAIQGGTTVEVLSIPRDYSVDPIKTTFLLQGKNLFDKTKITEGKYIDGAGSGNLYAASNQTVSDFIPVKPNTVYSFTLDQYGINIAYYDSEKTKIGGKNGQTTSPITTPEGTAYVRFSFRTNILNSMQFEEGSTPTDYEPYVFRFDEEKIKRFPFDISEIPDKGITTEKVSFLHPSKNLFNKNTALDGYYVSANSGHVDASSNYITSDFIEVQGDTFYSFTNSANFRVVYYTSTQTFISGVDKPSSPVKTPANARYVRFHFKKNDMSIDDIQFQEGQELTEYEEYGLYYLDDNIVVESGGSSPVTFKSHLSDKTIVCFGDSITGAYSYPNDYPTYIAERLGATVHNVGFSGAKMSTDNSQVDYDAFSMAQIVDSIVSGDFSLQDAEQDTSQHYPAKLATLKSLDFNNVDIITIFYGTNDFNSTIPELDNDTDEFDRTTVLGAARYAIRELQQAYPHLKIVLLSTSWRTVGDGFADDTQNSKGYYMIDLVEGLGEVANKFHVPFINMYNGLGINQYNYEQYLFDGLHPNPTGRKLMADRISSQLLSNL